MCSRSAPASDRLALLHVGDTKVVVDPRSLGHRLVAAGFATATVSAGRNAVRFCASMPNN